MNEVHSDHYLIKSRKFARVTTVAQARGLADFSKIPERDRDYYLSRGSGYHKFFEDIENGVDGKFDYDPRIEEYRAGHARFLLETGFKALPGGIEMRVKATWKDLGLPGIQAIDEYAGIAGCLDRLGTIQGRIVLIDYKGASIPKSCPFQTATYALMIPGYKFVEIERYGVSVRNDGSYKMSPRYPFSDKEEALYHINQFRKGEHNDAH